jgi:hypothetical protein
MLGFGLQPASALVINGASLLFLFSQFVYSEKNGTLPTENVSIAQHRPADFFVYLLAITYLLHNAENVSIALQRAFFVSTCFKHTKSSLKSTITPYS